jgi:hypothetical protein
MAQSRYSDRRKFHRNRVQARVRLRHSRIGTIDGYSTNISDNGLFVYLAEVPPLPKGAHLSLQMMDSVNPDIVFNTRVIRITREGIGVTFVDYEFDGHRYTLEELRRQWLMSRTDVDTQKSR